MAKDPLAPYRQKLTGDTLPKLLVQNCRNHSSEVAMRKKEFGIWNEYTWDDCYDNVKGFALGLVSLGLERGDRVVIIGDNDPQWFWAEFAVQAMGGAAVGLYVDAIPPEIEYIAGHSGSKLAVVKDQEQTDKFLKIRDKLPGLKGIIYWDPKGMWHYKQDPFVMNFTNIVEMGEEYDKAHPGFFQECVDKGKGEDIAVYCYTSGTTGSPKGAMISHDFLITNPIRFHSVLPRSEGEEFLSFVPPAWIAEQTMGVAGWAIFRSMVNFPEDTTTVTENIREIAPRLMLLGTRQWESLLHQVQAKMMDTSLLKRLSYSLCMPVGYKIADLAMEGKSPSPFWRLLYRFAELACLIPIKDRLGLKGLTDGITGGALLGPDIFRWFRALGVNLIDSYGLTEFAPATCTGRPPTVGASPPTPGTELRITDDGEILLRASVEFSGYYNDPDATKARVHNGWISTGDAGFVDEYGQLAYLDRVKDMLTLKGGAKYSPTYVENLLKFSPYIKDLMVVGEDYIYCVINIDFDNVGKWAERSGIPYTTFVDLSQKDEVYDLIQKDVVRVNSRLPETARIRRFTLLHKEFDPDEGELTRTRKLKRSFMEQRYSELFRAAYSGEEKVAFEAVVTYQDGRVGKITTDIRVRSVED